MDRGFWDARFRFLAFWPSAIFWFWVRGAFEFRGWKVQKQTFGWMGQLLWLVEGLLERMPGDWWPEDNLRLSAYVRGLGFRVLGFGF